jgi:hypothetical protein
MVLWVVLLGSPTRVNSSLPLLSSQRIATQTHMFGDRPSPLDRAGIGAAEVCGDEALRPRPADHHHGLVDAVRRLVPPHVLRARAGFVVGEDDRVRQVSDEIEEGAARFELAAVPCLDEVVGELSNVTAQCRRREVVSKRPRSCSKLSELRRQHPLAALRLPELHSTEARRFEECTVRERVVARAYQIVGVAITRRKR